MQINLRALPATLLLAGIIFLPSPSSAQSNNATNILLNGAKKWLDKNRADLAQPLLQKALLLEPNSAEALSLLNQIAQKKNPPHNTGTDIPAPVTDAALKPRPEARQADMDALSAQANDPRQLSQALADYEELSRQRGVNTQRLQKDWRRALHRLPEGTTQQTAIRRFLTVYPDDKEMIALLGEVQKNRAEQQVITRKVPKRKRVGSLARAKSKSPTAVISVVNEPPTAPTPAPEEAINAPIDPDITARTEALDALDDGDYEVAEKSLNDILTRRPQDTEVLGGLGMIRLKQGRHDAAIGYFEQALVAERGGNNTPQWQSLIGTAKFWKDIRLADDLLEENRLSEAETVIRNALTLQPDEPNALAVLGNIKAANNELAEAERLYRQVLPIEGYNVSAIRGLSSLLIRTQRSEEAMALIEHTIQTYPAEWKKDPASQAGLLREEADLYLAAHRTSHAIQALEMAVLLDPKSAWARFSLAKLYISLNLAPLARQITQEGVALAPNDASMRYVRALILLNLDDNAGALNSLAQIPEAELTKAMRATRDRALIQYYFEQAESKLAKGNRKEALRIMAVAETQARGNYAATEQVAEGWFKLGLQKQGLSAMRKLPTPVPLKTQVHFASLLSRAKKDQELADYLPTLRLPEGNDETSLSYRNTIREVEFQMAGRQYDKLIKAGRKEQAQQLADAVLNTYQLSSGEYFKYHRSYFYSAELPGNAISALEQEKAQHPNDPDIRWELADAYYQDKQNGKARSEVQELLEMTRGDDVDMRMRIAGLQQNLGNRAEARATRNNLINRYPNNTELLLQAARMARSDGNYNEAMSYYRQTRDAKPATIKESVAAQEKAAPQDVLLDLLPAQSLPAEPIGQIAPALASTPESDRIYRAALASDANKGKYVPGNNNAAVAEREMADISSRRTASVEAGLDIQSKSSNNGTSTYNATEIPIMVRLPIGFDAHATVQVDRVNIDSGALPSAFADAALFGKIQAFQFVPPQPLTPKVAGTSLSLGYELNSLKADIGLVGQGFPVSNIVGGIRKGGDFGRMSYSLNLSRRPVTDSLLSYAGTKDPVTGEVWGGVTNTGLSLYMSTKLNTFNVSAVASYGLLRGKNVLNNDRLYLRAAVDNDVYATDDLVINVGINANLTQFANNQSFYTFGHGGYYSPQNSLSFSLPVELYGRADLLSYQIRASLSYAKTRENGAPFYPTDPLLQGRAETGPSFPSAYNQAFYTGGTGGGVGFSLRAAADYRVTPNVALGGRFSMDRSAYYAPNAMLFYLRYQFNPETGPVALKPDPVTPYSQY